MLTDVFLEQELENQDDVERFCKKFEAGLTRISVTEENGTPEHMYFFSDGLGPYTIKGIRDSLEGK